MKADYTAYVMAAWGVAFLVYGGGMLLWNLQLRRNKKILEEEQGES